MMRSASSSSLRPGAGASRQRALRCNPPRAVPDFLRAATTTAAAAAILLSAAAPLPCSAEELTLRFKASPDPSIRAAQQQLVESWALASAFFVDADAISKPEWHDGVGKALDASFSEQSADGVRRLQDDLLSKLGDPFTRVLRGASAERLAAEEEGRAVSNGLALLPRQQQQQQSGGGGGGAGAGASGSSGWAVAYVAPGGPAAQAGVRVGDVVIAVDGAPPPPPTPLTSGAAGRDAAREAFLAKATREPVELRLTRPGGQSQREDVVARLRPAPVDVESVQWGVLRVGGDGGDRGGVPVAYLRIAHFSQRTPAAVTRALEDLFSGGGGGGATAGASSSSAGQPAALLVDLRDDVGGVVEAGVEVARQLLRPGDALAVVTARSGDATSGATSSERVVLSADAGGGTASSFASSPLYRSSSSGRAKAGAPPPPRPPIAVLTNHNTASTAELLAGSLRDGGPGATIVGERTFGKGRSQRVFTLQNGGAVAVAAEQQQQQQAQAQDRSPPAAGGGATLLVSTMRFATPSGVPIDGVGLEPSVACASPAAGFEVFMGGAAGDNDAGNGEAQMRALLEGDACVRRAAELLAAKVR
jgi:carboxyl-terminal processing protease